MANFSIFGSSSLARTLASGEYGMIGGNASLLVAGNNAIAVQSPTASFPARASVLVSGTVASPDNPAIFANGGLNLVVDHQASILSGYIPSSFSPGTNFNYYAAVVFSGWGSHIVSNAGTISGAVGLSQFSRTIFTLHFDGTPPIEFNLTNSGSITGNIGNGISLLLQGGVSNFNNSGLISGAETGMKLGVTSTGVKTADIGIQNSGTISGAVDGIELSNNAIGEDFGDATILNTGMIMGGDVGIRAVLPNQSVHNSGTIIGGTAAIMMGDSNDLIINAGEMIGDVILGGGNDSFRGINGIVDGQISGGDGEDTLRGGAGDDDIAGGNDNDVLRGSRGEDTLSGGGGHDLLSGGADNDTLLGGGGGDTLTGGKGDDMLDGGNNDDRLSGGAGADDLLAGDGNDTLHGGDDNDTLVGGRGEDLMNGDDGDDLLSGEGDSDTINGSKGDDTITGGNGGDFLSGGSGEDVFVFSNASHIGTSAAERDVISDFMTAEDMLDFTGLGLSFSAAGSIGGGTASVWLESLPGTLGTVVKIDADGDGAMDGRIILSQGATAVEGDLIL